MDEKKIQVVRELAFDMADKLQKTGLSSFELEYDDIKVSVKREVQQVVPAATTTMAAAPMVDATPDVTTNTQAVSGNVVKSPIVGTFYKSPDPGSESFVKIGSQVKRGDVLCIIEAMKMLNEIESEFEGEVKQIFLNDGDMVEFDQPIMVIE